MSAQLLATLSRGRARAAARRADQQQQPTNGGVQVPPTPRELEVNKQLQLSVIQMNELMRPDNTSKALDPKAIEYHQFCAYEFPDDPYGYHLCYENVYRFMYYQVFREQKVRGGNRVALTQGTHFDSTDYNKVIGTMEQAQRDGNSCYPTPQRPIGKGVFDQYKAMFRRVYKYQVAGNYTSLHWDQIWKMGMDTLEEHVKTRKASIAKANYAEKVTSEFAPYGIVEHYGSIERNFYFDSSSAMNSRCVVTRLRHRYCLLHLTSGILRCESLYRAELSDFIGINIPNRDMDIHQPYIMVNQCATGKTNKGRVLYGRATRHKDVRLCCIGALSMYLMLRFNYTKEFEDMAIDDWFDNKKWFDIKLLIDVSSHDNRKEMCNDSYGDHVKEILKRLGLPYSKQLHLGRGLGTKLLDLMEEEIREIQRMGQWNSSIYDNSYSSKLPMAPIRKLAGYYGASKMYFNTRTTIEPPDELLFKTPLGGSWIYKTREAFFASEHADPSQHTTAAAVLNFFVELNRIFLQDAAAMITVEPERQQHPMYRLPVFDEPEWEIYLARMKDSLANESSPLDANLEAVLPGIDQWHRANNAEIAKINANLTGLNETIKAHLDNFSDNLEVQQEESDRRMAHGLLDAARLLMARADAKATARKRSRDNEDDNENDEGADNNNQCEMDNNDEEQQPDIFTEMMEEQETMPQLLPVIAREVSMEASVTHFRMASKHNNLSEMWDEWHGCGKWSEDIHGGIKGRNKKYGPKWRRMSSITNQHHSRTKRIIDAIALNACRNKVPVSEVINGYEDAFAQCNRSVAAFVKFLQDTGSIPRQKSRGKTASPTGVNQAADVI